MNRSKLMYAIDHPETLPERAYCQLPSDRMQVIIVIKNETGYYPYQRYETEQQAKDTCEYCNGIFGATEEESEAMLLMSMRK